MLGQTLRKREGCGKKREPNGFINSLGSNTQSFILFYHFLKIIDSFYKFKLNRLFLENDKKV